MKHCVDKRGFCQSLPPSRALPCVHWVTLAPAKLFSLLRSW